MAVTNLSVIQELSALNHRITAMDDLAEFDRIAHQLKKIAFENSADSFVLQFVNDIERRLGKRALDLAKDWTAPPKVHSGERPNEPLITPKHSTATPPGNLLEGSHQTRAEQTIHQSERIALQLMAAAGLSIVVATGLIVEAGTLRRTYLEQFGFSNPAAYIEASRGSPNPHLPTAPHDAGYPLPSSQSDRGDPSNKQFAGKQNTREPRSPEPDFFQSVWGLRTQPSLSLGAAPERTMLDDWLEREAENMEKLERAARESPTLVASLSPRERDAFDHILHAFRSHQADNARRSLLPPALGPKSDHEPD